MKKLIIGYLVILLFILTACDSWPMNNIDKNEYIQTFIDYLEGDNHGDMQYYEYLNQSENYTIIDGVIIPDEDYIDKSSSYTLWYVNNEHLMIDINDEVELYYKENKLYTFDVIHNNKTFMLYDESEYNFDLQYQDFLDLLLLILNETNYDRYVETVKGNSDYKGHRLSFLFDEDELLADGIINAYGSVDLRVYIDLDDSIQGFSFSISNLLDHTSIMFDRSFDILGINNRFPDDLDDYIEMIESN